MTNIGNCATNELINNAAPNSDSFSCGLEVEFEQCNETTDNLDQNLIQINEGSGIDSRNRNWTDSAAESLLSEDTMLSSDCYDGHNVVSPQHLCNVELSHISKLAINKLPGATSQDIVIDKTVANDTALEVLDTDENSTQLRLSPSIKSNQTSSIVNTHNTQHIFIEATLSSQLHDDEQKEDFSKLNYVLPTDSDESSDKDSLPSPVDHKSVEFMHEITATVTSPEESSMDSGILSLGDTETAPTADEFQTKQFAKLENPLTGIIRKRRCNDSASPLSKVRKVEHSKPKVAFDGVTVFYFPRKQSFVTVPSQGGSTLGMSLQHSHLKHMTLNQHKRAIVRHRRKVMEEFRKQQRIDGRVKQLRQTYPDLELAHIMSMVAEEKPADDDGDDVDQDSSQDEEEEDESSEEEFDDDNYFLQPIPAKKRRYLLKLAGVPKIDFDEKLSNQKTRESREVCGCDCEKVCLPSRCQCAAAGIPCQVDRESFPCGCVATGCFNPKGRVEFDVERVKKHYIQTMRRLRLLETGAMEHEDKVELPQPPKSPYVSSPDPDKKSENRAEEPTVNDLAAFQQFSETNVQADGAAYNEAQQLACSPQYNPWGTMPYPDYSSNLYNTCGNTGTYEHSTSIDGSFENIRQGSEFLDHQSFCDVAYTSSDAATIDFLPTSNASPGPLADIPCKDFSFAEEHFVSSGEPKLLSVSAESGYKQICKLDPIASFFSCSTASSHGGRQDGGFTFDMPESIVSEVLGQSTTPTSTTCAQSCSFESILCPDDPGTSRSRSSSISECSHDSIVKA